MVQYIPGKENLIPDTLCRWAYPASEACRDVSRHGSAQDADDVKKLIEEENAGEYEGVNYVRLVGPNSGKGKKQGVNENLAGVGGGG